MGGKQAMRRVGSDGNGEDEERASFRQNHSNLSTVLESVIQIGLSLAGEVYGNCMLGFWVTSLNLENLALTINHPS